MSLILFYITNKPEVALIAEKYGVDRIWIDLETLGKEERQKGIDSVKSHHTIEDIRVIKPLLSKSKLLVRINPWNDNSVSEIENVINAGADIIMFPMWSSLEEVSNFLSVVKGRTLTSLLLETKEAVQCIDDVLKLKFDEIHIGLNDLHLSYKKDFMFELLSNGMVEMLCKKFSEKGIPYGFGGIAKLGEGLLPAEDVVMEHYRLGSTRAILSRSFCDYTIIDSIKDIDNTFKINMNNLRTFEKKVQMMSNRKLKKNKEEVAIVVQKIVTQIRRDNNGK